MNALQSWMIILLLVILVGCIVYVGMVVGNLFRRDPDLAVGTIVRRHEAPHPYGIVVQVRNNRFAVLEYPSNTWTEYELKNLDEIFMIVPAESPMDIHDKVIVSKLRAKAIEDI